MAHDAAGVGRLVMHDAAGIGRLVMHDAMGIGRLVMHDAAGVGRLVMHDAMGGPRPTPGEPPHGSINLWSVVVGGSRDVTGVWVVVVDHADDPWCG